MAKKQVKQFLEGELRDEFLMCRDYGHSWVEQEWEDHRRKTGEVIRYIGCANCTTQRIEYVGANSGEVNSRRYKYPEGYIIRNKDIRKGLSKSEFRRESIRRMIKGIRR